MRMWIIALQLLAAFCGGAFVQLFQGSAQAQPRPIDRTSDVTRTHKLEVVDDNGNAVFTVSSGNFQFVTTRPGSDPSYVSIQDGAVVLTQRAAMGMQISTARLSENGLSVSYSQGNQGAISSSLSATGVSVDAIYDPVTPHRVTLSDRGLAYDELTSKDPDFYKRLASARPVWRLGYLPQGNEPKASGEFDHGLAFFNASRRHVLRLGFEYTTERTPFTGIDMCDDKGMRRISAGWSGRGKGAIYFYDETGKQTDVAGGK